MGCFIPIVLPPPPSVFVEINYLRMLVRMFVLALVGSPNVVADAVDVENEESLKVGGGVPLFLELGWSSNT